MKSYSRNEKSTSHTFSEEPRASHQAPMHEILETYQRKANRTGLPDELKTGIENQSGYNMDDVQVHYNSSKPAQLNALAYTQGTDIHVAPGQEQHLPYEAWHVVQQKQGRVQPTTQMQGVNINDNEGLEKEADVMGGQAVQRKVPTTKERTKRASIKNRHNIPHPFFDLGSWYITLMQTRINELFLTEAGLPGHVQQVQQEINRLIAFIMSDYPVDEQTAITVYEYLSNIKDHLIRNARNVTTFDFNITIDLFYWNLNLVRNNQNFYYIAHK